jgi:hypothetical protein
MSIFFSKKLVGFMTALALLLLVWPLISTLLARAPRGLICCAAADVALSPDDGQGRALRARIKSGHTRGLANLPSRGRGSCAKMALA